MLLQRLQALIENIYDVDSLGSVADFLVTDRRALGAEVPAHSDEQLLVAVDVSDNSLAMSLFLDAAVIRRLGDADPVADLHSGNIADYLTVLEGVSHFVCVAWHAQHDRPVSLMNLEMQAEIDKYVATTSLMRVQSPERFPAELHRLLFARAHVAPQLARGRERLYGAASQHAAKFCQRIERRLRALWRRPDVTRMPELCRLYRMPDVEKLAYIAAL